MTSSRPPELRSISHCDTSLQFETLHHWPQGLPAVAINGVVVAGFEQDLVFDHQIDHARGTEISELIASIYPQMSFMEAAFFWRGAKKIPWLPLADLFEKWNMRLNEAWMKSAELALNLPIGFQKWLADKKVGAGELLILSSDQHKHLEPILHAILTMNCSRTQGIQALELFIELSLMQHLPETLVPHANEIASGWIERLKELRYPQTTRHDRESAMKLQGLPWPGQSQARWVRQGDRSGLELKLFVSNPSELKKSLNSLQKIQELLDDEPQVLWPKH